MEHFPGDECGVWPDDYELIVIGHRERQAAWEVGVGAFVRDPANPRRDLWFEVDRAAYLEEGTHLLLVPATAGEVAQARRDACEGHETTRGAIGDTYYCDGSCV